MRWAKKHSRIFTTKMTNTKANYDISGSGGPFVLPNRCKVVAFITPTLCNLAIVQKVYDNIGMDTLAVLIIIILDKSNSFCNFLVLSTVLIA